MRRLPKCFWCDVLPEYDGLTTSGFWAYMCPKHFYLHGVGLGEGKGAKLSSLPENIKREQRSQADLDIAAYEAMKKRRKDGHTRTNS